MRAHYTLLIVSSLCLSGCYDHIYGAVEEDTSTPNAYESTFDGVLALHEDHCASCHSEAGAIPPYWDTDLEADVSSGAGEYIVAGDPEASVFWIRIKALDGTTVMPPGAPLPSYEVDHVYEWIESGAGLAR